MGLLVWLPLNGDIHNQGIENVVMEKGTYVSFVNNGKIGSCATSTASNNTIQITMPNLPETFANGKKYTLTCWAKLTGNASYGWVIHIGSNSCGLWWGKSTARWVWNENDGGKACANPTISGDYNNWHHLAIVVDKTVSGKTTTYAYVDGLPSSGYETHTWDSSSNSQPAGDKIQIYPYHAYLNDIRIYDNALSPREIKEISKGLLLHYPLSREGFGADNIIPNTWPEERTFEYPSSSFSDRWSCVTAIVPTASQYTLSFWAKSTVNGDKIRTHFYSPNTTTTCVSSQGITRTVSDGNMDFTLSTEWEHYWVTYSQNETTAVKHVICPRMGAVGNTDGMSSGTGTVSIKCIKLEEGDTPTPWIPNSTDSLYSDMGLDSNVVYDVSGYENNGTKSGMFTYSSDTPCYFTSTVFENNYIVAGKIPIKDELTYSWWAYSDHWGQSLGGSMVSSVESGGMGHQNSGTAYLQFICGTGTSSNDYGSVYQMPAPSAGWHMFTTTWDGYSFKVYLDGDLKSTNTRYTTKTPMYYTANYNTLFIGGESGSSATTPRDHFVGKLSDVRVYATALTADEIADLYHTPISLSNTGVLLTQGELSEV